MTVFYYIVSGLLFVEYVAFVVWLFSACRRRTIRMHAQVMPCEIEQTTELPV